MMGKHISRNVVISKNKEALSYGMRGIAYGAVYAASKQFFLKHKDWAFYYPDNKPITFIDVFYLNNGKFYIVLIQYIKFQNYVFLNILYFHIWIIHQTSC